MLRCDLEDGGEAMSQGVWVLLEAGKARNDCPVEPPEKKAALPTP